ncbi:hypothetical protein [Demequina salsinemoris]|uniref:hypothetical protein n=1 Tax=Demequina salsinemoris TaxID=577470 RepID=UPI00078516DC|nr:hypothetical protein [Demequina salsinemoris]
MAPARTRARRLDRAAATALLATIVALTLALALTALGAATAWAGEPGSSPDRGTTHDDGDRDDGYRTAGTRDDDTARESTPRETTKETSPQSVKAAPRFKTHGPVTTTTSTPTLNGVGYPAGSTLIVTATGTTDDGATVSGRTCTATPTGSGSWSCTFTTPLPSGSYQLRLVHQHAQDGRDVTTSSCRLVVSLPEPVETEDEPEPAAEPPAPAPATTSKTTKTTKQSTPTTTTPAPDPTTKKAGAVKAESVTKSTPAQTTTPASETTRAAANIPVAPRAVPTLPPIDWSFTIVDSAGKDIGGRPLVPGEQLAVLANGLPEGAKVRVELHSTPISLVNATVDATGSLIAPFTLPASTSAGAHALVATLTAEGFSASVSSLPVVVAAVEADAIVPAENPVDPEPPVVKLTPVPHEDYVRRLSDVVPSLWENTITPYTIATTGGLAAVFVLLAALPAELLQSTLTENYGRAFAWLTPVRRRTRGLRRFVPRRLDNPWLGSAFSIGLTSIILGFSEPQFGLNTWSVRTFLALYLSLYAINIVTNIAKLGYAAWRFDIRGVLSPLPGGMVIAAASVLISRGLDIQPSLLFGLVVGITLARTQSKEASGRIALVGAAAVLALGIVSWLALSFVELGFGHDTGFLVGLMEDTFAATALEALTVLLVGLLPFEYLEGKDLHDWDQRIWAGAYFVAAAAFVFIAVPLGESWDESQSTVLTWVAIVAGFAAIAMTAWVAFRLFPAHEAADEERERIDA